MNNNYTNQCFPGHPYTTSKKYVETNHVIASNRNYNSMGHCQNKDSNQGSNNTAESSVMVAAGKICFLALTMMNGMVFHWKNGDISWFLLSMERWRDNWSVQNPHQSKSILIWLFMVWFLGATKHVVNAHQSARMSSCLFPWSDSMESSGLGAETLDLIICLHIL